MYEENQSISDMAKETLRLTQENNRMIKGMRRDALIGGVLRIVLWIAVLVGSFYLTMQYLDPLLGSFSGEENGGMSADQLKNLYEQYKNQLGE